MWRSAEDPATQQIKLELFFGGWVFLVETGWLIYGNTFIYDEEVVNCDSEFNIFGRSDLAADVDTLRTTTLVLICYGYLQFLGIIGLIIFAIGAYAGYK